jgi:hypothetical protein
MWNHPLLEPRVSVEFLAGRQQKSRGKRNGFEVCSREIPALKTLRFESVRVCHVTRLCLLAVGTFAGASHVLAGVAVQYHCVGSSQLAAQTTPTKLQKVLALRPTTSFQNVAVTKFSRALTNTLRLGKNPSSAALIAPLFSDLVEKESLGSFGGASANEPGFILAVHLETQRAQLWLDHASKIFGGEGEKFTSQEFSGRRWNAGGSNSFWIIPARDWLLAGRGDDFSPLQVEYLNQLAAQGRPTPPLKENWLEADIASAGLGGWFRYLRPASLRVTIKPNAENLQLRLGVFEAEAIPWKSDPWQIPKDLMRGQIISYTAGQNVAAFLNVNPAFSHLAGNPLTNQFYFWALDQVPMLNFMAWPQVDASNTLARMSTELPSALNAELKRFNGTELAWLPEAHKLICRNMRLFAPALEALQSNDGQFLFLSSFPRPPGGKPAPDALLAQFQGRTNLVYYDWEATGRRLMEWQILRGMIANRALAQSNDGVDKAGIESEWLSAVVPLVGNTVTEITRVAPKELSVARTAPIGFTAVELVLLADWLCDANSGPIHSAPPFVKKAPLPAHP